jgi:hypothetical protein
MLCDTSCRNCGGTRSKAYARVQCGLKRKGGGGTNVFYLIIVLGLFDHHDLLDALLLGGGDGLALLVLQRVEETAAVAVAIAATI